MPNSELQDSNLKDTIRIESNGEIEEYPINSELVKYKLVRAILEEAMENESDSEIKYIIYDFILDLDEYYSEI